MLLKLPPNYALFENINLYKCRIDVEECLNKLRWKHFKVEGSSVAGGEVSEEGNDGVSEVNDAEHGMMNENQTVMPDVMLMVRIA